MRSTRRPLTLDISHFRHHGLLQWAGSFALAALPATLEGLSRRRSVYGDLPNDDVLQKLATPTILRLGHA